MHHFLIADDHPLFRQALLGIIHQHYKGATISESADLESTLAALDADDTDLLLLDLNMPGSQDLFGLMSIREKYPTVPVVVVSASEEQTLVNRAIQLGASGFIPKSTSTATLHIAIDKVIRGESWVPKNVAQSLQNMTQQEKQLATKINSLTPQQYRVLHFLREGWLNKQIAFEMGITEATVKAHITAIFKKLDVNNRTQAVIELSQYAGH